MRFKSIALSIFAFMLLFSSAVMADETAQSENSEVALYVTLLGHGGVYSVGGEYLFLDRQLGFNINASYFKTTAEDSTFTLAMFPVFLSYYYGSSHRLYADLGATLGYAEVSDSSVYMDANGFGVMGLAGAGYNYNSPGSGFYFKIGPSVMVGKGGAMLWGGITFGYSF